MLCTASLRKQVKHSTSHPKTDMNVLHINFLALCSEAHLYGNDIDSAKTPTNFTPFPPKALCRIERSIPYTQYIQRFALRYL